MIVATSCLCYLHLGIYIYIIVLFMLHCSGSNVFLDTENGDARKIITSNDQRYWKSNIKGYQEYMRFLVTISFQFFSRKGKEKFWKTLLKYPEYLDIFANPGTNEIIQEDTAKELESFVCKIYGYKNLLLVKEVRKCRCLRQTMRKERDH